MCSFCNRHSSLGELHVVFELGDAHNVGSVWAWGVVIDQASGHAPVNHPLR